jgi:hypothetical protein
VVTRSAFLGAGSLASGETRQLFTVPDDRTVLLKSLYGYINHASGGAIQLQAHSSAGHAVIIYMVSIGAAGSFRFDGWAVMDPASKLLLWNGALGATFYWCSGTVLQGVVPPLPATRPGEPGLPPRPVPKQGARRG